MGTGFTVEDLEEVAVCVAEAWAQGSSRDWTVLAGTLEWSCQQTANHAVDTLIAPAFFLASRRLDRYPEGGGWSPGDNAPPEAYVEGVQLGTRILAGVVRDTPEDVEAILFRTPRTIGRAADFAPRGALELVIHAHDVCAGLGIGLEPPRTALEHLRQHVKDWPFWGSYWPHLSLDGDPWTDLLSVSGRLP